MSASISTPRSGTSSATISQVAAASASTQAIAASLPSFDTWWSTFTIVVRASHSAQSRAIAPVREGGPSVTTAMSGSRAGVERTSPMCGSPASAGGTGSAATTSTCFPRRSAAIRRASAEPSVSASGFSWQMIVIRVAPRIASATASRLTLDARRRSR